LNGGQFSGAGGGATGLMVGDKHLPRSISILATITGLEQRGHALMPP
jgi:hypothetical protein